MDETMRTAEQATEQTSEQPAPEGGDTLLTAPAEAAPEKTEQAKTDAPAEKAPETPEAPETYDLKAPDGMELDADLLQRATPLFKELKLSGEQAQKLADLYADKVAAGRKAQLDAWNATLTDWRTAAKNDPEIGGDRFAENVGLAREALDRFGSPELRKAMDDYGMGNHPELIRLLCKVGKAMKEDSLVPGEGGGGATDPGRILYPNMA